MRCAVLSLRMLLYNLQYWASVCCYALAVQCAVLSLCTRLFLRGVRVGCYAMCGTELAYAATRCAVLGGA
eukprot:2843238-Rhodomonas_salina.1